MVSLNDFVENATTSCFSQSSKCIICEYVDNLPSLITLAPSNSPVSMSRLSSLVSSIFVFDFVASRGTFNEFGEFGPSGALYCSESPLSVAIEALSG